MVERRHAERQAGGGADACRASAAATGAACHPHWHVLIIAQQLEQLEIGQRASDGGGVGGAATRALGLEVHNHAARHPLACPSPSTGRDARGAATTSWLAASRQPAGVCVRVRGVGAGSLSAAAVPARRGGKAAEASQAWGSALRRLPRAHLPSGPLGRGSGSCARAWRGEGPRGGEGVKAGGTSPGLLQLALAQYYRMARSTQKAGLSAGTWGRWQLWGSGGACGTESTASWSTSRVLCKAAHAWKLPEHLVKPVHRLTKGNRYQFRGACRCHAAAPPLRADLPAACLGWPGQRARV